MARLKKSLGIALCILLCVVNLVLLGWLLRDLWLAPLAVPRIESALGAALGAQVRIGAIEGSLLRDLRVRDVDIDGADAPGPIENVTGATLEAAFDPLALAAGDFGGLAALRIDAERIVVRIPRGGGQQQPTAPAEPWPDVAALERWLRALPEGAVVTADEFVLRAPTGETLLAGPLRLELSPAPRRRLELTAGDLDLDAVVTRDGLFHLEAELEDLLAPLERLGVELPVADGTATVRVEGDLAEREARATVTWRGGRLQDRGPARLLASAHLRGETLQLEVDAAVPGGAIEVRDVALDLDRLEDVTSAMRNARGSVALEVEDLQPWAELLPPAIVARLPIRGRLRAHLERDTLEVGRGVLRGDGVTLTIERGRLPLTMQDARTARGEVTAAITVDEPLTIPVGDGEVTVVGRVEGRVEGTIEAPTIEADVALGGGRAFDHAWESLTADATFTGNRLRVDALEVVGVRPADAPADAGTLVRANGVVELPGPGETAIGVDLDATVSGPTTPWLAALAPGLDPTGRVGPAAIRIDADLDLQPARLPTGTLAIAVESLDVADAAAPLSGTVLAEFGLARDGAQPFEITFDGVLDAALLRVAGVETVPWTIESQVPTRASLGGTIGPDGLGGVEVELRIDDLRLPGAPPIRIVADAARAADGTVDVRRLTLRGPVTLNAQGTIPADPQEPLDVALTLDVEDTAAFGNLVPGLPPGAVVHVDARLTGPRADAEGRVTVDASFDEVPAALEAAWPEALGAFPPGDLSLQARIEVAGGAARVDTLQLVAGDGGSHAGIDFEAEGTVPLRMAAGGPIAGDGEVAGSLVVALDVPGIGPARLSTPFTWTESDLALSEIVVGTAAAGFSGRLAVHEIPRALAGEPLTALPVAGALALRVDDAMDLPPEWLPPQILGGALRVDVTVDGTLGAPAPRGTVTVADARLKLAPDVPILDEVAVELELEPTSITLADLRGRVGIGAVTGRGTVIAAEGTTLLSAPRQARVDLTFAAEDALLIRSTGRKLRVNASVAAAGDLDRLDVTGDVEIQSGRFIRRISLVPDIGTKGGMSTGAGIQLFSIPPPLGPAIHFDLAIRTVQPIEVVTHVFNSPLAVSMRLRGTGEAPYLDGAVSSSTGSVRLPAITLDVTQALITFAADDPGNPRILVTAGTRRHNIDVTMTATGRLDAPEVLLSSLPPLTQQELFVLVSTGVLPETLQDQGLAGRATMVGGYLAKEIIDFYFGSDSTEQRESIIDRFHFYSGREISRNGVESLVVDFDITDNIALEGERDVYEDYNMGILYRIRF